MKAKILDGKYIVCVLSGENVLGVEITDEEYTKIKTIVSNAPTAENGFFYKLTDSLEWELFELSVEETVDEEATEADYQAALRDMGVDV